MSEYIINGTLLTNIANAVRSIDGSTSTLTPQQMETRLKAIKSSIDSALSALTAKEVEIPSDSTIHRLADLIAAIETGSNVFSAIATGTVTTSVTRLRELEIVHGLGVAPDFAVLYVETDILDKRGVMGSIIFKLSNGFDLYINAGKNSSGTRGVYFHSKGGLTNINLNDTKVKFKSDLIMSGSNSSTTANFDTYSTYRWIAGVYA